MDENVLRAAREAAHDHPNSIDAAVDEWFSRVSTMDHYSDWLEQFVRETGRKLIEDCRHQHNLSMRRAANGFDTKPKVVPGAESAHAARSAVANAYRYYIAGKQLGDVLWEDLERIAESEERRASGHIFNASLCRALWDRRPKSYKGKAIRDAMSEKKLGELFVAVGCVAIE